MYLLNLSLAEFLALFGFTSGLIVALYLLDRTRRRQVVATLRFWTAAAQPVETRRRRRIRQPWSLALQLATLALLLLAAAQLRWGSREDGAEDHVLILDTSAWMAARTASGTLMEEVRRQALAYLDSLPAADRVMLIRAEALATPVTAFEGDRELLRQAIEGSRPGAGALHLTAALDLARRVHRLQARRAGEVVYVGGARTAEPEINTAGLAPLRLLLVEERIDNVGIHRVGLRHSPTEAGLWEIYVSVRNYGAARQLRELAVEVAGAPAGVRRLPLATGADAEATFPVRTRAAATVELRLIPEDAFPADDRTRIELPSQPAMKVLVFSERPERLRPALESSPFVQASYLRPGQPVPDGADLVVLDQCPAPAPLEAHTLWIEPPAEGGPVPLGARQTGVRVRQWRSEHPIAAGLATQEFLLRRARILATPSGFEPVATVEAGPVVVAARDPATARKIVVLGFDPMDGSARYQLAAPLLVANILRWIEPGIFRRWELNAGSIGTLELALEEGLDPAAIKVLLENGVSLPATVQAGRLRFFSGAPGIVRVLAADREVVYSLNLPEIAPYRWDPPASALTGLPAPRLLRAAHRELWRWLAALAGLLLFLEWLWFGRTRQRAAAPVRAAARGSRWWPSPARVLSWWAARRAS